MSDTKLKYKIISGTYNGRVPGKTEKDKPTRVKLGVDDIVELTEAQAEKLTGIVTRVIDTPAKEPAKEPAKK